MPFESTGNGTLSSSGHGSNGGPCAAARSSCSRRSSRMVWSAWSWGRGSPTRRTPRRSRGRGGRRRSRFRRGTRGWCRPRGPPGTCRLLRGGTCARGRCRGGRSRSSSRRTRRGDRRAAGAAGSSPGRGRACESPRVLDRRAIPCGDRVARRVSDLPASDAELCRFSSFRRRPGSWSISERYQEAAEPSGLLQLPSCASMSERVASSPTARTAIVKRAGTLRAESACRGYRAECSRGVRDG